MSTTAGCLPVQIACAAMCFLAGCNASPAPEAECSDAEDCDDEEICDDGECRLPTCSELLEDYSCSGEHVTIGCVDPDDEDLPVCFCDAGFADLTDDPGCEDPAPFYEDCCYCMQANTSRYDLCLPSTADQCIQALEAGGDVGTDGACALNECAGSCARVNCDAFGCRGY